MRFHPEARLELREAVFEHEDARVGFGQLLRKAVEDKTQLAEKFPKSGTQVEDLGPDVRAEVRRYTLSRFRYHVVVARIGKDAFVVAVAHTSRDPDYWHDRLR